MTVSGACRGLARLCGWTACGAVLLVSPQAAAQADAGAGPRHVAPLSESLWGDARDAYQAAGERLAAHDFAGALGKYEQAYEVSHDPRLLFNMAICERDLHAYARMQGLLLRYEREAGDTLNPEQRADIAAALAAIHSLVGTVKLAVNEVGADVSVDGERIGVTPLAAPFTVDTGVHAIRVTKPGFDAAEQNIDVPGGDQETVAITFVALVGAARLIVSSDAAATISLDQKPLARGRFDGRVPSGLHDILVTENGKRAYQAQVSLTDGDIKSLQIALVDTPRPVLWPWIAGGAAVVAGAIVGGYFLFKHDDSGGLSGSLGSVGIPAMPMQ